MADIITLFRKHGNPKVAIDYLKARDLATEEITNKGGWGNLTDLEKDYIIEFFINIPGMDYDTSNATKISHLMSVHSMTLQEAGAHLAGVYPRHHIGERNACLKRAQSKDIMTVMQTYLNIVDMADFVETTKDLYDAFKDEGIRGSQDGQHGMGLFDWIENTGDFAVAGLIEQLYVYKQGTAADFKVALMDILRNGNYIR